MLRDLCVFGLQEVMGQLSLKQGFPSGSVQNRSKNVFKMAATGP